MIKKLITQQHANLEPQKYLNILLDIKHHVEQSQVEAFAAINIALNMRNWIIGKIITEKQEEHVWGSDFIERLAKDLQNMYPGNKGFSITNIYRIRAFYDAYRNIPTAVGILEKLPIFSIPWGHNTIILEKIKNNEERLWYALQSIEKGWSRSSLEVEIKKDLFQRQGKAITNFKQRLPHPDSAIVQQSFKDPYIFDFLTLTDDHVERDVEKGLIDNVQQLLLELGKGFALVGRQYHVQVGRQDFYIDLLFYHTKLRCYIVVELKSGAFDPRDAGQLNFYLSAVDNLVKDVQDGPTIGLLLCKSKDNVVAEYALQDINKPMGVAEYTTEIMKKLEKEFISNLPTIAELEAQLNKTEALHQVTMKKSKK